ncbi:MAG TPA: hypothetical protein VGJ26_20260 [Pirellulales bacterium]|jgi:hypothetical protein
MLRAVDIEEIVRAVLKQLQGEPQQAGIAPSDNRTLELTDKLVTLATLENRLIGIDRVALRAGAVVTPAALDELRSHGVTVVRAAATEATPATRIMLTIGVAELADKACDVPALIASLSKSDCAVERIAQTGLASVTAELSDHAARNGRPALLLTARPTAAACLANRRRGVRAVGGKDARGVLEAIQELAANFVAVDPAALSAFELRRLVSEYCAHWPRPLPKEID